MHVMPLFRFSVYLNYPFLTKIEKFLKNLNVREPHSASEFLYDYFKNDCNDKKCEDHIRESKKVERR